MEEYKVWLFLKIFENKRFVFMIFFQGQGEVVEVLDGLGQIGCWLRKFKVVFLEGDLNFVRKRILDCNKEEVQV